MSIFHNKKSNPLNISTFRALPKVQLPPVLFPATLPLQCHLSTHPNFYCHCQDFSSWHRLCCFSTLDQRYPLSLPVEPSWNYSFHRIKPRKSSQLHWRASRRKASHLRARIFPAPRLVRTLYASQRLPMRNTAHS